MEQRKLDLAVQAGGTIPRPGLPLAVGGFDPGMDPPVRDHLRGGGRLRHLLHPDVWPHAGRSSFVTLLVDKAVPTHGVAVEKAVGLRLTFRQPPPIDCFSNQFLFYLNSIGGGQRRTARGRT